MRKLVMIRHGESVWNMENRFTGWTDVDLSEKGRNEAQEAGEILKKNGFIFDIAYTSMLKRAIRTLWIIQDGMDLLWIPVFHTWRLNERHYGALQGLNKKEAALNMGEEKVHIYRRSYDVPPPPLEKTDERYPGNDPRYKDLTSLELPLAESLKDTITRMLPYWLDVIIPSLKSGKRVIIAAHGNSLRGLVQYLDGMSASEVAALEIPTGIPIVYELHNDLKKIRHYYLEK